MTTLNFDTDQLGSMELYSLRLQKVIADFTDFDAVTKAYVDQKIDDITNGLSSDGVLNTIREISDYLTDNTAADGLIQQINTLSTTLSTAITNEASRAGTEEGKLDSRVAALESDPTTGASVSALQAEVNRVETGAGLTFDGDYTANASSNYLSLASSLKDADNLLDTQLKTEQDRASGAETLIQGNLTTHIATYESDKKQADADRWTIGERITDLDTSDIAEGDKLFYTEQRVKDANVHNYSPFNPSERTYDPPVEATVGYAFELLNAELQDIHTKEDADDTRHNDLTVSLSTVSGTVTTERNRAIGAEDALSTRVEVFEEGLNNGMQPDGEYYQENLGVQAVVDDLRGGIDYVNGQREADKVVADSRHTASEGRHDGQDDRHDGHDTAITGLSNDKFDKVGGQVSGDASFLQNVGINGTVGLNVQHASQDETTNGTGKYLYFSDKWRMYGKSDGSRLVFEYNGGTQETPNWRSAIPFISSV